MESLPAFERDPRLRIMEATVVASGDDGGRSWVVLDDTILYPEGGGQPADRGAVAGVPVLDVQKAEGEIRHYVEAPVAPGPARRWRGCSG